MKQFKDNKMKKGVFEFGSNYLERFRVMIDEAKAVTTKQDKTILEVYEAKHNLLKGNKMIRLYEDFYEVVMDEARTAVNNEQYDMARKLINILEEFDQIFKEKINE